MRWHAPTCCGWRILAGVGEGSDGLCRVAFYRTARAGLPHRLFAFKDLFGGKICAWLKPKCPLSGRLNNILTNSGLPCATIRLG